MHGRDMYTITLFLDDGDRQYALTKPLGADFTAVIWKCRVEHMRELANCHVTKVRGLYRTPMQVGKLQKDEFDVEVARCTVHMQMFHCESNVFRIQKCQEPCAVNAARDPFCE